jgi:histone acetyltransferase (RNA polymerase elongator complex component)
MPGLPGENQASVETTLKAAFGLAPDEVRLYPTVVLKGTPLAGLYRQGRYRPLSLDQAVAVCGRMYKTLTRAGIRISRIGLQDTPTLASSVVAGPYHPALGHLVKAWVYYQALVRTMSSHRPVSRSAELVVAPPDLSQAQGPSRTNLDRLKKQFNFKQVRFTTDPSLPRGRFRWREQVFTVLDE